MLAFLRGNLFRCLFNSFHLLLPQITAPALSSPECRSALVGSADSMLEASQQLAARVSPLQSDVTRGAAARDALQALQRLAGKLDKLKAAVEAAGMFKCIQTADVFVTWLGGEMLDGVSQ